MKVTSFEISKKLAEIGFKAETIFYYNTDSLKYGIEPEHACIAIGGYHTGKHLKAYDFETILDALPMGIDRDDKRYTLTIEQRVFFYYSDDDGNELEEFSIMQKGDESLADVAARLLIRLYETGLIKFNEE